MPLVDKHLWERTRQFVPNKRESSLRLTRWRKLRRSNRRRKSVLSFWWGPLLICALAGCGFVAVACKLSNQPNFEVYQPEASLYVVHVTEEQIEKLYQAENVRSQAMSLSDEDVGISLDAILPEPQERQAIRMVPMNLQAERPPLYVLPVDAYLPKMREHTPEYTGEAEILWVADSALRASRFAVTLPYFADDEGLGEVRFAVELNEAGHVVEALRFAPAGAETERLRQLREAILKGRGRQAARGEVRIFWKTRIKK